MSSFVSTTVARPMARAGANPTARPNQAVPPPAPLLRPALVKYTTSVQLRGHVVAYAAQQADAPAAAAIPEEELIQLTKDFVDTGFVGVGDGANLADDFVFRGPVVGPLPKKQYVEALASFKVAEAFPDLNTNSFGFSIDPTDPYRVWFFSQTTGTHTGNFAFGDNAIPPSGGKIRNGVEAASVIWTPDRKVKYISAGYCVDRINSNTPNGTMKVAVAGLLRATGNGGLWDFVTSPVVLWFTNTVNKLRGKPSTDVPFDDLPDWWKELPDANLRGAQNYHK